MGLYSVLRLPAYNFFVSSGMRTKSCRVASASALSIMAIRSLSTDQGRWLLLRVEPDPSHDCHLWVLADKTPSPVHVLAMSFDEYNEHVMDMDRHTN